MELIIAKTRKVEPLFPKSDPNKFGLDFRRAELRFTQPTDGIKVLNRNSPRSFLATIQESAWDTNRRATIRCVGTGFFISPLVMISARHVFSEHMPLSKLEFEQRREITAAFGAYSYDFEDDAHAWGIVEWNTTKNDDVAILSCEASGPDSKIFRASSLPICLVPPSIGDELWAIGLPGLPEEPRNICPLISSGKVIDRWDDARDSIFCRGPSFAIDCYTAGAMSGGPVVDARGRVRGIVTSCLDQGNRKGVTFASSLFGLEKRYIKPRQPHPQAGIRTPLSALDFVDVIQEA